MNFSNNDIDLYCKGQMPQEKREAFEATLKNDVHLQEEVTLRLALIKSLQDINREALKKTLKEASSVEIQKPVKHYWRVAAVFAILVAASIWYYFNLQSTDVFSEYYAYYPNYEVNITRGNSDTTLRAKPFIDYSNKSFTTALSGFDNNLKQDPLDYASKFYRGLAYLELNQPEKSIADLEVAANTNSRYAKTAAWYAALAAIKLNNIEKATVYLSRLANEENPYQEKSSRLLKKLKRV